MQKILMKKDLSNLLLSMREKAGSARYPMEHLYFDDDYVYATNGRIAGRVKQETMGAGLALEKGLYKVLSIEKLDSSVNELYLEPLIDITYPDIDIIFKTVDDYTPEKTIDISIPTKKREKNQVISTTIAKTAILSNHECCCDYTYIELLKGMSYTLSYNQSGKQYYFRNEEIDVIILPLTVKE